MNISLSLDGMRVAFGWLVLFLAQVHVIPWWAAIGMVVLSAVTLKIGKGS